MEMEGPRETVRRNRRSASGVCMAVFQLVISGPPGMIPAIVMIGLSLMATLLSHQATCPRAPGEALPLFRQQGGCRPRAEGPAGRRRRTPTTRALAGRWLRRFRPRHPVNPGTNETSAVEQTQKLVGARLCGDDADPS